MCCACANVGTSIGTPMYRPSARVLGDGTKGAEVEWSCKSIVSREKGDVPFLTIVKKKKGTSITNAEDAWAGIPLAIRARICHRQRVPRTTNMQGRNGGSGAGAARTEAYSVCSLDRKMGVAWGAHTLSGHQVKMTVGVLRGHQCDCTYLGPRGSIAALPSSFHCPTMSGGLAWNWVGSAQQAGLVARKKKHCDQITALADASHIPDRQVPRLNQKAAHQRKCTGVELNVPGS
ncbi:hypothetical protein B0H10DRAFT_2198592 [Mycena sp. CBHHK59/15]|nr:hypothetical protein B0H10DRAFT_2198592 [Mycena sp. CBHHK59/15]